MKTFREFIIEAKDAVKDATYTGDAAEQERIRQRELKRGFDPDKERAEARRKAKEELLRNRSKKTKVPGGKQVDSPFSGKTQTSPSSGKPPTATPPKSSAIVKSGSNVPGGRKIPGLKGGSVLSGVIDTALEKQSGSGWRRSLAKGATTALGTAAGAALGSAVAPGAGTFVGGAAGAAAAGKAFDTVAGANAKDRAAMRQQKRQSQSGGALVGTGGKTTFDTKKHTMTTGTGPNQKTIRLTKLSAVKDPKSGNLETGYLAYKGGKAVYKRADTSNATLARTSSNPWERLGRTFNPNAYKASDEAARKAKLQKAIASDNLRNRDLGINKNKVGPKVVGQKIVGPKKVGPAKVGPKK